MNPTSHPPYSAIKLHCTDTAFRMSDWCMDFAPGMTCLPVDANGNLLPPAPVKR